MKEQNFKCRACGKKLYSFTDICPNADCIGKKAIWGLYFRGKHKSVYKI